MESGGAATLRSGGEVRCVALAGGALAGGAGAALRLWRASSVGVWRLAAERPGAHRYGVTALAWGAALLASGGVDGAVRLWGGGLRGVALLGAPGAVAVRALCWVGARLAAGHDDGALRVWDARGVLLASLRAHEDALTALAAPAAALLVTAAADGVLKVYDFNDVCSGSESSPLEWQDGAHDLGALCAAASPHLPVAATAGHDGRIRIWRMHKSDGKWKVTSGGVFLGHSGAVSALCWTGDLLASASHDRTARLWRLTAAADDAPAGVCVLVLHAHTRYLTTVAVDYRQRFLVTGSSDKTIRVWTLGDTSVDDEMQPICEPSSHFGLGDLEGIEPITDDELLELDSMASSDSGHEEEDDEWCGGMCARRVYSLAGHGAPVNCLCASGGTLAAATSDGSVYVWTWRKRRLRLWHKIVAHEYPALCVALPTPALLSSGLDGVLKIWDLERGFLLRTVCAGGSERVGEEAGAGVRGAAVSRGGGGWRAALATDAGTLQLWTLADDVTQPDAVYAGFNAACACAAWSACGGAVAGGGAAGELRVWAPRRDPPLLATNTDAHDLGVQAIGWSSVLSTGSSRVLASVGADSYLKLWIVEGDEDSHGGSIQLATSVEAHGGAAAALCWQPDVTAVHLEDVTLGDDDSFQGSALVATGGEDRWARVWAARRRGGQLTLQPAHAAHLRAPVLALAMLPNDQHDDETSTDTESSWYLAVGTLSGAVSVWALQGAGAARGGGDVTRHWGPAAVAEWLKEYLTTVPGSPVTIEEEVRLLELVNEKQVSGAFLLDTPIAEVLEVLGYAWSPEADGAVAATRRLLLDELHWLRRPPHPHTLESLAPHHLLCPLTHTLFREPVRAADGFTYERTTLAEHFLIEGGPISGVTGRRMLSARVQPNRGVRDQLRAFLLEQLPQLYADLVADEDPVGIESHE